MVEHRPEEAGVPGSSPGPSTNMLQKIFLRGQAYERHFSAFAMVAGFIADNIFFGRIDLWQTQVAFISYATICFVSIPLLCWFETRTSRAQTSDGVGRSFVASRLILPIITQFALGGFWSGFVIFYGRSANLGASWPFLLFLLLVFLGSEYFYRYHSRLVFTSVLFFFALYSYAIFAVPIYTGNIGTLTFLMSGVIAALVFALFTMLLRVSARERFFIDVWRIRAGAFCVLVVINVFYFTNVLPPLPLSAEAVGIYHSVGRIPGAYLATDEVGQSFAVRYLGFAPTLHVIAGETASAYSSVFAPTILKTTIVHRWQWYDPIQKEWILKATIVYPIAGGRDGGYRGYSTVLVNKEGEWRVNIETEDGRLIARVPFTIDIQTTSPILSTITLK